MEKKSQRLYIRNIDDKTIESLRALSLARYGKANASQYVRSLIDEALKRQETKIPTPNLASEMKRFQITIPLDCYSQLCQKAEERFSSPQFFVAAMIYRELEVPQLYTDQVETLRNSNYNLAKIGTNINQIAKAFNQLVMNYQGKDKLPPIGKEMDKLKKAVADHIEKVLNVLNQGTVILETRGKGTGNEKREATLEKKLGKGWKQKINYPKRKT
jgi:DNA polymerase III alpha subunit